MFLAYLDESYTRDYFVMASVVVHADRLKELEQHLEAVVRSAQRAFPKVQPRTELHAHELVSGEGPWACLRGKHRASVGIYLDAAQQIAQHADTIIIRAVDVRGLKRRYGDQARSPHTIALQHTLERLNEFVSLTGEHILVIADEVDEKDVHRRALWDYREGGTTGYRPSTLDSIVDTLHFAPSSESRLLQAADLIAFLARRRQAHVETNAKSEAAFTTLWATVEPIVSHNWCWHP